MITPKFTVAQDNGHLYLTIHAPHVRAQTVQLDVDSDQFKFFASPYYLRLTFPGPLNEEEDHTVATFDAGAGDISVKLTKLTPGQQFPNLDMLTGLLATRKQQQAGSSKPLIEEVMTEEQTLDILQDEDFDWELEQTIPTAEDSLLTGKTHYGFNRQYTGMLAHVHETPNEINQVLDPEHTPAGQRRIDRIAAEDAKFDHEYFLDNYMNDADILPLLAFRTKPYAALRQIQKQKTVGVDDSLAREVQQSLSIKDSQQPPSGEEPFTEDEQRTMMDLPRKTHIISNPMPIYLGLVDLLFAYSLDHRINQGEPSVESAWAIGAVSSTLSNLEELTSLNTTLVACFRRALAYPLYRHWDLCEQVVEDLYVLFKLGRRTLLKAMLELKRMFDHHDVYYIYSKLYLDDYCVWLQTEASDKTIKSLAHELHYFVVEEEDTGWKLDELVDLALMTSDEEEEDNEDSEIGSPEDESHQKHKPPLIQVVEST